MTVNRDEFFAELDTLTDQEIHERLPLWDREKLLLVQDYVDRREGEPLEVASGPPKRARMQSEVDLGARDAAVVALEAAKKANTMAVSALILSAGAILTATLAGAAAYLALQN